MKGLRISVHGKVLEIALPEGSCGPVLEYNRGECRISINGASDKPYLWYKAAIKEGDRITVEFTEIDNPQVPEILGLSEEQHIKDSLEEYHRLEKELTEAGILTK